MSPNHELDVLIQELESQASAQEDKVNARRQFFRWMFVGALGGAAAALSPETIEAALSMPEGVACPPEDSQDSATAAFDPPPDPLYAPPSG